jgi:hypothetical protein
VKFTATLVPNNSWPALPQTCRAVPVGNAWQTEKERLKWLAALNCCIHQQGVIVISAAMPNRRFRPQADRTAARCRCRNQGHSCVDLLEPRCEQMDNFEANRMTRNHQDDAGLIAALDAALAQSPASPVMADISETPRIAAAQRSPTCDLAHGRSFRIWAAWRFELVRQRRRGGIRSGVSDHQGSVLSNRST